MGGSPAAVLPVLCERAIPAPGASRRVSEPGRFCPFPSGRGSRAMPRGALRQGTGIALSRPWPATSLNQVSRPRAVILVMQGIGQVSHAD